MAIDKLPQSSVIRPGLPGSGVGGGNKKIGLGGNSFEQTLKGLQQPLTAESQKITPGDPLRFSNHAVNRMRQRGIRFDAMEMGKIEDAVGKARAKGARETLILTDKAAMVVSVKNNTVVTVVDKSTMKENVFTNIDSTVMI